MAGGSGTVWDIDGEPGFPFHCRAERVVDGRVTGRDGEAWRWKSECPGQ